MNDWTCPDCDALNDGGAELCELCGHDPSATEPQDPSSVAPDSQAGSLATFVSPSVSAGLPEDNALITHPIGAVPSLSEAMRARPARLRVATVIILVAVAVALAFTGVGSGLRGALFPAGPLSTPLSPAATGAVSQVPDASPVGDESASATALRTVIAAPDFGGHVDLYGTITIGNTDAGISGTVDFASGDFRSESRFDRPLAALPQHTIAIVVNGQVYVRAEDQTWAAAAQLPRTLATQLLDQIDATDELTLLPDADPANPGLVRLAWPNAAAILGARIGDLGGARVHIKDGQVDILLFVDGVPVRIKATLRGTWALAGKTKALRAVLTYQYAEIGHPIAILAPRVHTSPAP